MRRALNGLGLIENKRVTLNESKAIFTTMAGSVAKLGSIVTIAHAEADALSEDLRLVILSDRVRADELPRHADSAFEPAKLGVVPIFEALRRGNVMPDALAVLTGTLVILPIAASTALDVETGALRIDTTRLSRRALPGCPGYFALEAAGDTSHALVALVTRLFQRGAIRVLVGTQALLGEGWDAPAINSLILASNAGSYMLSNQMRGRAIRVDPDVPRKVAAIWHLATIAPDVQDGDPTVQNGDLAMLVRRFDAFEGIGNGQSARIENGIDRLELDIAAPPDAANGVTLDRARNRAWVAAKWRASLGGSTPRSRVRRVAEANYAPRPLVWRDTLQALIVSALSGGALSAAGALRHFAGRSGFLTLSVVFFGATFLYSLPKLIRAVLLWVRHGSLERSLAQVGALLVASLHYAGVLSQDEERYAIVIRPSVTGRFEIIIDGATRAEERVFLDALAELLGPVQNPRYLLVRESSIGRMRRTDYHGVPAVLGARKDLAEHFHRQWQRRIGASELIFTRTGDGRRKLLKARVQSLAAGMQRFFERRSVWL